MPTTRKWKYNEKWKATIDKSLFLLGLYVCLRYLGGFSSQQSVVVTGLGWLAYGLYDGLNTDRLAALQRSDKIFSPFYVHIRPNWETLLSDFKLVHSEQEWHRLYEATNKLPTSEYNVFRSGVSFTVVAPPSPEGTPPGLTYWDDRKSFFKRVDLSESIVEYERHARQDEHPYLHHPAWGGGLPRFTFKLGTKGFDLGLEVQRDWWLNMCQNGDAGDLAKIKPNTDYQCGTSNLVVATLPYSEFGAYYQELDYDQVVEQQKGIDKELETRGWKRHVEKDPEFSDPWEHVEHRYFDVSHRDI